MVMINPRTFIVLLAVLSLSAPLLHAQDLGRHREARLGSDVLAVAAAHGLPSKDAKTVHARPALIQDLEWRSRRFLSASAATDDPVSDITFSFYNDQLFRIVANYDRQRTEGLTDADLIEAMTTAYGPPQSLAPARPAKPSPQSLREKGDEALVIARWEDAESSVTLMRARYPTPVSLVVFSKRLAGLARSADAEAARLDRLEAPGREVARIKQEAEETRASGEKARPANKAIFKP
jgi:hypothetical protein